MYKYKYLLVFFYLWAVGNICFAQNNKDNPSFVEVEIKKTSKQDNNKARPSNINRDDVEELLALLGIESKKYQNRKNNDERLVKSLEQSRKMKSSNMAGSQLKNFPAEALVFYSAIGASMYRQSVTDALLKGGRLDPIWLNNLLHEITSPVGMFSFLAFILVSGQTNILYSKWLSHKTPFTKGFFKGKYFIHKSIMPPHAVQSQLYNLRRAATLKGTLVHNIKYQGTRMGMTSLAKFGGVFGMGAGMMASNIVHELDFMFSHNINYKGCFKTNYRNSENQSLSCDLFWDQLQHTAHTWGPELVSLVTASFLSHWLVSTGYRVGIIGAQKIYVTGSFLKGAVVRSVSASSLSNILKVIVFPIGGGFKIGGSIILKSAAWIGKYLPNNLLFRFINLYAFMEMSSLVTGDIVDQLWTENIHANNVSSSLEDFTQYQKIDQQTVLNCDPKNKDNNKCKYHDSVFAAHKIGNSFTSWRQYKIQIALQAYNNWFQYVSSAMGSYDITYALYKELFKAKQQSGIFYKVSYFGDLLDPHTKDHLFINQNKPLQDIFTSLVTDINNFIKKHKINEPVNLNKEVVSLSNSYFIKRDIKNKHLNHVFILRYLLSAIDPQVSIKSFYGDKLDIALLKEIKKLKQSDPQLKIKEINKIAQDNLRKRVLAAGIEHLIDIAPKKIKRRGTGHNSTAYTNLFSSLYKKAKSIKPNTQGMHIVHALNNQYIQKEKIKSVDYHPDHIGMVYTPHIVDFILVSSLCGPDLSKEEYTVSPNIVYENKDQIIEDIPVFDRTVLGTPYQFYPPQLPNINIDSDTRKTICSKPFKPTDLKHGINIYNSSYTVKGKTYNNLLHLVLDNIEGTELNFETWWSQYMEQYIAAFINIVDLEYEKVIESDFIYPLFNKDTKKIDFDKNIMTSYAFSNSLEDHIGAGPIGVVQAQKKLKLPKGVFSNIHFELRYWSDVIIYFSQKMNNKNIDELTVYLDNFINVFKTPAYCDESDWFKNSESDQNNCQKWVEDFLKVENLNLLTEILETNITYKGLGINTHVFFNNAFPEWDINTHTIEEFEKLSSNSIGAFAQDVKGVPSSLIQFAVIRLRQISEEAQSYAHNLVNISSNPEVQGAIGL